MGQNLLFLADFRVIWFFGFFFIIIKGKWLGKLCVMSALVAIFILCYRMNTSAFLLFSFSQTAAEFDFFFLLTELVAVHCILKV